ncbi:MAG: hypothetical protein WAW42_12975 [Candidatus Competibacteraceae bacterium]
MSQGVGIGKERPQARMRLNPPTLEQAGNTWSPPVGALRAFRATPSPGRLA